MLVRVLVRAHIVKPEGASAGQKKKRRCPSVAPPLWERNSLSLTSLCSSPLCYLPPPLHPPPHPASLSFVSSPTEVISLPALVAAAPSPRSVGDFLSLSSLQFPSTSATLGSSLYLGAPLPSPNPFVFSCLIRFSLPLFSHFNRRDRPDVVPSQPKVFAANPQIVPKLATMLAYDRRAAIMVCFPPKHQQIKYSISK